MPRKSDCTESGALIEKDEYEDFRKKVLVVIKEIYDKKLMPINPQRHSYNMVFVF